MASLSIPWEIDEEPVEVPTLVWFVIRPGRDWVPDGAAASDIWWSVSPTPVVYVASKADSAIGVCMNNAWYAASTINQTYVVYADESDDHRVHLVRRPMDLPWLGDWPVVYTCSERGASRPFPCLALRRQPQADGVAFAVAWRGVEDRLWAANGGTDSPWEEVDITALGGMGLENVLRFCLAMDESLNTWLVFSATALGQQGIFLTVRPHGGTWSVPSVVSSVDDFSGEAGTFAFESVDFPSVAVSGDEDEHGPTVVVVYVVSYSRSKKRVLGKAARVADVAAAGWILVSVAETDVGHSAECRDPCIAATSSGTFVAAYSAPTGNANINVRHTTDPVAGGWSDAVEIVGDVVVDAAVVPTTRNTQNFASVSLDEVTGRCFVCWEDTAGPVTSDAASTNGAVAELSDLTAWTPLGILTGGELPPEIPEGLPTWVEESAIRAHSTRFPCVVAMGGRPRLFYTAFNGTQAELVSRFGRWL